MVASRAALLGLHLQRPIQRHPPDREGARDGGGAFAAFDQLAGVLDLRGRQRLAASDRSAARTGGAHPGPGAFLDQRPLEFRKRAHHVKEQAAPGGRRVDAFRQRPESRAARAEIAGQLDQVRQRPAQPVEPPDGEDIPLAQDGERPVQAGPLHGDAIWRPPLPWWTPNQLQLHCARRSPDHAYAQLVRL